MLSVALEETLELRHSAMLLQLLTNDVAKEIKTPRFTQSVYLRSLTFFFSFIIGFEIEI